MNNTKRALNKITSSYPSKSDFAERIGIDQGNLSRLLDPKKTTQIRDETFRKILNGLNKEQQHILAAARLKDLVPTEIVDLFFKPEDQGRISEDALEYLAANTDTDLDEAIARLHQHAYTDEALRNMIVTMANRMCPANANDA